MDVDVIVAEDFSYVSKGTASLRVVFEKMFIQRTVPPLGYTNCNLSHTNIEIQVINMI